MARAFVRASSQDIHVGNVLDITGAGFSVAAWVISPDADVGDIGRQEVISKEGTGATGWTLTINTGLVGFGVFNGSYLGVNSVTEVADNTWSHIGGTYATSGPTMKVYLQGVLENTAGGVASGAASDTDLRIGRAAQSAVQYFDGSIAEIAVWDATLSDAEMAQLALGYSPVTVRRSQLLAYFPLIRDLVELRQAFTLTNNGTTVSDHPRVIYPPRRRVPRLQAPTQLKISQLAALTDPALTDLLTSVDDVAGTALNKKFTISELSETFGVLSNIVVQTKTVGSGTYTPTTGMKKVLAIGVGGGGAGAGGINTDSAGGGGGGGGTVIRLLTAADIGASKAYVVGAAGAATTLDGGTLLNAGGGGAGTAGATFSVVGVSVAGGAGGTAANGDLNIPGEPGQRGIIFSGTDGRGGRGGKSLLGAGGAPGGTNVAGGDGAAYGGGGAGGHAAATQDRAGGAGASGILYLIEWIS